MIELNQAAYKELLDSMRGIPLRAATVLMGYAGGCIFVDKPTAPSSVYIYHQTGVSFLFGEGGCDNFDKELLRHFENIEDAERVEAHSKYWEKFMHKFTHTSYRQEFDFDQSLFEKNNGGIDLDIFAVKAIDAAKVNFEGRISPDKFWKQSQLGLCICFAAIVDDNPVSLAFAGYQFNAQVDIAIETLEAHRRKGLARATCVALIRHCLREGLTPIWSCRAENAESIILANKLGFIKSAQTPYFFIRKGSWACS